VDVFTQQSYRCKLEWGRRGTREAVARGDILVVVDTLSFSSAVVTAVQQGGLIYPCAASEDAAALAHRVGGELAVARRDVPAKGRFSLSPLTFLDMEPDTRVVLASPNGATCSRYARETPYLFVGALLNAEAVATAVAHILAATDLSVTVVACGERWQTPSEDGELRVALEDYLGAGAILAYLEAAWQSPEARVCAGAFVQARPDLSALLWECGSGRELREKGYAEDVRHAAQLNRYDIVPVMQDECLQSFHGPVARF
jgi:2-phosphosulfolactate phosphatase